MTKKMKVSIAMGTYNGSTYLNDQLESLARQSLLPSELVICDDSSTDNTVEILEQFKKRAPFPVRIHVNSVRLGWRENFMNCAQMTKGDLIAFCDQDDVWNENKLERCEAEFHHANTLLVMHAGEMVDAKLEVLGGKKPDIRITRLFHPLQTYPYISFHAGCGMVFSAKLVHDFSSFRRPRCFTAQSEIIAHDYWIYFLARILGDIKLISEPLIKYRVHGKNTVGVGTRSVAYKVNPEQSQTQIKLKNVSVLSFDYARFLAEDLGEMSKKKEVQAAVQYFSELGKSLGFRASFYEKEKPVLTKIKEFCRLVISGVYFGRFGKFGMNTLTMAKDIFGIALYSVRVGRH